MKKVKRIIGLLLSFILILGSVCVIQARTYPNANLNIANRPNDSMRADEFIALISHISYWSKGVTGTYTTDKGGKTPVAWAAPYVQSEVNKKVVDPKTFNYSDPATVAFAAKYLSNARGLYHWDFVNKYDVAGTENLSAEDKMYLNVAFDNGLIKYYKGISAKTVFKRKDVSSMLLDKPFKKVTPRALVSDKSMKNLHVFFENNGPKMDFQFNLLKKYSNSITQVSFFGVKSVDSAGVPVITYDKAVQNEAIKYCRDNGIQSFLVLDNYNFGKGGYAVYDQNMVFKMISNPDATISSLMTALKKYNMDGINVTFDMFGGKEYRDKFSIFMNKLGTELKKSNKLLMVSVGAYFKEKDELASFYNYDVLGKVCDFVHIILYDENSANAFNSGTITKPGCNSSLVYIDRVLKYASYRMPPERIYLGTQSFAISFGATKGSAQNVDFDKSWLASPNLVYDSTEGSGHITSNGKTIYFETDGGMRRRMLMVYDLKLGGMSQYSLISEFEPIYTLMNSECPQKAEIISAMRKKLVPNGYYRLYSNGIRRDQFCDFIVKFIEAKSGKDIQTYLKEKNITVNTKKFTDTQSYNVAVANALGIVSGRSADKFGLEIIKRQEAATMLMNLAKLFGASSGKAMQFSDTNNLATWARTGISFTSGLVDKTNSNRVMNGVGNNNFGPYGVYTRAQTIMTMVRLFNAI